MPSTLAGGVGSGVLQFGGFPGITDAVLVVTGQTNIQPTSLVEAWIYPQFTADHSPDEHLVENIKVMAYNIVSGVGFSIRGMVDEDVTSLSNVNNNSSLIYGQWAVGWVWA